MKIPKLLKWGVFAAGGYVAYRLITDGNLNKLLGNSVANGGSTGSASTIAVSGKPISTANSSVSVATGQGVTGSDGSSGFTPAGSSGPLTDSYITTYQQNQSNTTDGDSHSVPWAT